MDFSSILFQNSNMVLSNHEPVFFRDLHLHDIMEKILVLSEKETDILSYFYTIPNRMYIIVRRYIQI